MTPRRWLNVAVIVVLLVAAWRVLVPFDGDCGPAVYESFRADETEQEPSRLSELLGYDDEDVEVEKVFRSCPSDARRRVTTSAVSTAVVGIGYGVLRRQLPNGR